MYTPIFKIESKTAEPFLSDWIDDEAWPAMMDRKHILVDMITIVRTGGDPKLLNNLLLNDTDLSSMNLAGLDFTGSNMSECYITDSNIDGTNFTDCDLTCSNFARSSTVGIILTNAIIMDVSGLNVT